MLENLNNYGMFAELVQTGHMTINTDDINIANWDFYYHGCLAVMQDGIDTKFVQRAKVDIIFGETKEHCKLSLPDLYFNLIMWYMIVRSGEKLSPKHLFFDDVITKKTIKKYIDDLYIIPNRKRIDFKEINNTIDDALHNYMDVDIFSMYLANTINLEDFISLAKKSDRFNAILHADLSQVPLRLLKILKESWNLSIVWQILSVLVRVSIQNNIKNLQSVLVQSQMVKAEPIQPLSIIRI